MLRRSNRCGLAQSNGPRATLKHRPQMAGRDRSRHDDLPRADHVPQRPNGPLRHRPRRVIPSGATPTVGVGAVGYSTATEVLNIGAVLQVTPIVMTAGDRRIGHARSAQRRHAVGQARRARSTSPAKARRARREDAGWTARQQRGDDRPRERGHARMVDDGRSSRSANRSSSAPRRSPIRPTRP